MLRSAFILTLIANLLVCPVRCLGCQITVPGVESRADVSVDGEIQTGCACCRPADDEAVPQPPTDCPVDCDCKSCICKGAVTEVDISMPDGPDRLVHQIDCLRSVQCEDSFPDSQVGCQIPIRGPLLCGRDVRIAHQSLQI